MKGKRRKINLCWSGWQRRSRGLLGSGSARPSGGTKRRCPAGLHPANFRGDQEMPGHRLPDLQTVFARQGAACGDRGKAKRVRAEISSGGQAADPAQTGGHDHVCGDSVGQGDGAGRIATERIALGADFARIALPVARCGAQTVLRPKTRHQKKPPACSSKHPECDPHGFAMGRAYLICQHPFGRRPMLSRNPNPIPRACRGHRDSGFP